MINLNVDETALPDTVGARLIDGYVDVVDGAKVLRKRPGAELFCDLGVSAPIDGLYWWDANNVALAICNGSTYKITSRDGDNEDVTGDALTVLGPTTFDTDGSSVIMASGGKMITYDNSDPTAFIADEHAPTAVSHVAFLDGYILCNDLDTGTFYWSDLNDMTAWTATSFANAEAKPDVLVALKIAYREITLFGKDSIEIWYNDGVTPFSRIEGAYVERGCIAPNSIKNASGVWIWLDNERRVSMLEGRQLRIVSGPYDAVMRDIASASDAYANLISLGNHAFYILTFPTANLSFVYDLSTGLWAEWGVWNSATGAYDQWWGKSYCYAKRWQYHLVGDRETGKIYKMRTDLFQDAGDEVRSLFRTAHVSHGTLDYKFSRELLIRCKRGLGSVAGSEPVIMVRWRDDNGPWKMERQVSLGKIGERELFKRLRCAGRYRTRQWEIAHTDNSDFVLSELQEKLSGYQEAE